MKFHRATLAAIAATTVFTLSFADGSGANAQPGENQPQAALPLTEETVPQVENVQFVSEPLVQAITEQSEDQAADGNDADVNALLSNVGSLRQLVATVPSGEKLSRQMKCLAGAIYFESRGEPLAGQLAVAKVIINRAESSAFPSDYCGVVYQRSQFSFVRGGRMPHIRTASAAWKRAKAIARIAHEDLWESKADDALYFHARRVNPRWSRNRVAAATISSHVFYK
ncbi:cell wall hydrolase [Tsuneonella flava]|uniref:Cell wall hydrolase n=1 Tax=Tsuneonella flava TaxID=2055955 RepID=A0ABX7KAS3_9SPHN|nr:cell wall hydrolase [Tsuneonella flava]QSB45094.1 cell wall hydrolase [Tsuneonella flava]